MRILLCRASSLPQLLISTYTSSEIVTDQKRKEYLLFSLHPSNRILSQRRRCSLFAKLLTQVFYGRTSSRRSESNTMFTLVSIYRYSQ